MAKLKQEKSSALTSIFAFLFLAPSFYFSIPLPPLAVMRRTLASQQFLIEPGEVMKDSGIYEEPGCEFPGH